MLANWIVGFGGFKWSSRCFFVSFGNLNLDAIVITRMTNYIFRIGDPNIRPHYWAGGRSKVINLSNGLGQCLFFFLGGALWRAMYDEKVRYIVWKLAKIQNDSISIFGT